MTKIAVGVTKAPIPRGGNMSLLRKCHTCFFLSFLRKQESSEVRGFWTPASAGVTAFL